MLKKRIIPVQLLLGGRLVKTVQFDTYRDVGDPVASSRVYNSQYADELIFLNINRDRRTIDVLSDFIAKVSEVCFMPLAFGGGVSALSDAEKLIRNGADKVIINSECYRNPTLIAQVADKFGSQAVVASIDALWDKEEGDYKLYSGCGRRQENKNYGRRAIEQHVESVIRAGAGEILINSIDRDGTMSGYDIPLIERVVKAASVPVIGCGGAGHYEHLREAFVETGASALACGSLFNFGDNNPIRAKAFLSNYNLTFKRV